MYRVVERKQGNKYGKTKKKKKRGSQRKSTFCCNASLNMNKRINLEVIKDTTITLPSRILAMQI